MIATRASSGSSALLMTISAADCRLSRRRYHQRATPRRSLDASLILDGATLPADAPRASSRISGRAVMPIIATRIAADD
jgi:hypothetical protein